MKIYFPKNKKAKGVNWIVYIVISLIMTLVCSGCCFIIMSFLMKCNYVVTSSNRGDYLSLLGMHCSTVFLTTSLMAVLSEKSRYVYWVDVVNVILIYPKYLSFLALSAYAISTVLWSFVGLVIGHGFLVIGSFLYGLISVTVLFGRMISVYYLNDKNKEDVERGLYELISKGKYEEYEECLKQLKEITIIKAGNREFYEVYDNIKLIENSLLVYWEKEPRKEQFIFSPQGTFEILYTSLLFELASLYTQETQNYMECHASENDTIKELICTIYPIVLSEYLEKGNENLFDKTLSNWSKNRQQKESVIKYITNTIHENKNIIANYYAKLFNPFEHEIIISDNFDLYISVIEQLLFESKDNYQHLLDYKGNRESIYMHCLSKFESFPLDVLIILAEAEKDMRTITSFDKYLANRLNDEIYRYKTEDDIGKKEIEERPLMEGVIRGLAHNRCAEDVKCIGMRIIALISNLDSSVYMNAIDNIALYSDFEKWSLDYALITTKKDMEKEDTYHHCQENKEIIDVLQELLEALNYKGRRKKQY